MLMCLLSSQRRQAAKSPGYCKCYVCTYIATEFSGPICIFAGVIPYAVIVCPGAEAPSEPMVRLLVQVQLPQKEPQLPAPPSAAKQQSGAPKAAVLVGLASCESIFYGLGTLGLPLTDVRVKKAWVRPGAHVEAFVG